LNARHEFPDETFIYMCFSLGRQRGCPRRSFIPVVSLEHRSPCWCWRPPQTATMPYWPARI